MPSEPAIRPLPRRRPAATDPRLFTRTTFTSAAPDTAAPDTGDAPSDPAAFLRALGRRVRFLRLTRELTQDELATAAGISRSFLSLVEKGAHGIDIVRLLRLAAAFDLSLTQLVDISGGQTHTRRDGVRPRRPTGWRA